MKSLSRKFLVLLFAITTTSCGVIAGVHDHVSYAINKVWADGKYLYVVVERKYTAGFHSLLNIHGTEVIKNNNLYYLKLDKSTIADGDVLDLSSGIPISGRLVYIDSDFEVNIDLFQRTSATKLKVTVTNRSGAMSIYCDSQQWRLYAIPLRIEDKLIYCGHVIPVNGNIATKFPEPLEQAISQLSYKSGGGGEPPVAKFAYNDKDLLLLFNDNGHRLSTGAIDFLKIDLATLEVKGVENLPFQRQQDKAYMETGSFRRGFLIEPKYSKIAVYACSIRCNKFNLEKSEFYGASALFVADEGDSLLLLKNTSKFAGSSNYIVKYVKAEVNK